MKPTRRSYLVAAIILSGMTSLEAVAQPALDADGRIRKARQFAGLLATGEVEHAAALFDEKMADALPPANLAALWRNLEQQAGKFKSFGEARASHEALSDIVYLDAEFDRHALRLKIVFTESGQISGLWIHPAEVPEAEAADTRQKRLAVYRPPSYDRPHRYTTEQVSFGEEPWQVRGVITTPRGEERVPAVVLVHGSGPHDEDQTIGPNKPFRDLAAGLSSRGVAVLRYKKRTHAYSLKLAAIGRISVREEVIDDALAALRFVREHPRVDPERVYLVGHSLGGTLAPQIAWEDGKVAGAVLLAGTARDLTEVLLEQLSYIADLPLPNQAQNQQLYDEALDTLMRVRNGEWEDDATVLNVPVSYWNELTIAAERSLDTARGLKCRVLIVGGGRDYQVRRKDFDLYKNELMGRENVTFKWFKDCNHLFFAGKGMSTPKEYEQPGNVDEEVVKYLVKWIINALPKESSSK